MHDFYNIIAKYLSGEASPEEAIAIDDWIAMSEENKSIFEQYSKIYESAGTNTYIPDYHTKWATILAKSGTGIGPAISGISLYKIGSWILSAILLGIVGFYYFTRSHQTLTNTSQLRPQLPDSIDSRIPITTEILATFSFTNTPLPTAFDAIENAYGVSIIVPPKGFDSCRVTSYFDNKGIEDVMNVLSFTLQFNFDVENDGKIYRITGEGCE